MLKFVINRLVSICVDTKSSVNLKQFKEYENN